MTRGPFFFAAALLTASMAVHAAGYSTFLGGFSPGYGTEHANGLAIDPDGNAYIGGMSASSPFPATRRYGTNDGGGFVLKLSPDGAQTVYSTFFENIEIGAVRWAGPDALYALGHTSGSREAITLGEYGGGHTDAVLLKLNGLGELLWARYLGGGDMEVPRSLALDPSGNICVAGCTTSTNFPTTLDALQRTSRSGFEGFVAKVDPAGTILFASYFGGAGDEFIDAIATDSSGRILVAGVTSSDDLALTASHGALGASDAFVARIRADGTAIDWLTLLGGSARDAAVALAVEPSNAIVLLGTTASENFPASPGALQTNLAGGSDLFVARLSADGAQLVVATYLGSVESEALGDPFWASYTLDGEQQEKHLFPENAGFAVGPAGALHIAARNNSPNFPAFGGRPVSFGGNREAFFARVSSNLTSLLDLQFLGGATDDEARALAVDATGSTFVAGTVYSPSSAPFFVASSGALQTDFAGGAMDGFVKKIPASMEPDAENAFAARRHLSGARLSALALVASATLEASEPPHPEGIQKSLWFSWRAPRAGRLVATTAASSFPAGLAVYSGTNLSSLILLARDLQNSPDLDYSRVIVSVSEGAEYQIAILARADETGLARLSLSFSEPSNDDFAQAILLSGLPASASATNRHATAEPAEPAHNDSIPVRSLWWKWVAPDNRSVAVGTIGSDFDTVLAVYTGTNLNSLERVISNDDANNSITSEAAFLPQAGRTYYIAVDGVRDQTGSIKLRIVSNDPPANDDFSARATLAGPLQNIVASNLRATLEPGEPGLQFTNSLGEVDPNFGRATVWWTWQAPKTGRLRLDTLGSDFDTRLGLYSGDVLTNLVRVAASDDIDRNLNQRASRLELDVVEGTRFAIQVDGSNGSAAGLLHLNLRLTFPPRILPGSLGRDSQGAISFQIEGVPGETYRVETSGDLKTWAPVGEYIAESGGAWRFTVPASHPQQLFIRLASRP